MTRIRSAFLCFLFLSPIIGWGQKTDVDICVYGGTSAGVIAAYTARMQGKSVVLVEPGRRLGGLSSGGLGFTDIGNKSAVTGISRDFYRRIGRHYGKFEQWIFEPHVAEETFRQFVREAMIDVRLQTRLVRLQKTGTNIQEITVENTRTTETNYAIRAKVFIDCSYEGDLMAMAGVSYKVGRESNEDYNEIYNGVQVRNKHQFPDGIDPYKVPGQPSSGLLWGISAETLPPEGTGDNKVQAYNFRICLTSDPANRIPITQPGNYDSTRYELLIRLFEKEPDRPLNLILKMDHMPNQKTDINNNGPFSTDMIGMNYAYPEAGYDQRMKIQKDHEDYTRGLLYFIGHSKRIPVSIRSEMQRWGYPKDEFVDNGNWSPQMYIREARRMIGSYVMTQANCEGKEVVTDGVGMAAYTMDSHNTSRVIINGMVKNEGDVQVGGFPPYPISYKALVPKAEECTNLLVPVCLSATHIAYGSIRMEPVFMVLGQSSALAAVQVVNKRISVQNVDVPAIQSSLINDPLADQCPPEILIDNESARVVKAGEWIVENNARIAYGPSLFKSASPGSSIKFYADLKVAGAYQVYYYVPRVDGLTEKMMITVNAKGRATPVTLNTGNLRVEGQTSGEWMAVGEFVFDTGPAGKNQSIEVTSSANGTVVADAVLLIPVRR